MKKILLFLIRSYQKTISPDHSYFGKKHHPYGFCKFYPTCSQYSYKAVKKFGIFRGGLMSVKRILRCNPFSRGGFDPVK